MSWVLVGKVEGKKSEMSFANIEAAKIMLTLWFRDGRSGFIFKRETKNAKD